MGTRVFFETRTIFSVVAVMSIEVTATWMLLAAFTFICDELPSYTSAFI
jgi:hypothetical protein